MPHTSDPFRKMTQWQVLLWAFLTLNPGRVIWARSAVLHHRPHVIFTAVLSMDMSQHRLSGERPWISNASLKAVDALCVSAGTTHEGRTPIVSTDAVHSYSVHDLFLH
jgi:hypothetical protein